MATTNLPYSSTGYAQNSQGLYYTSSNPSVFYNAQGQVVQGASMFGSTSPQQTTTQSTQQIQPTSLNQNLINQLRSQIQNGQISPQDALGQYKQSIGYSSNASLPTGIASQVTGALYSGLGTIKTPDGQYGTVDGSGNVTKTSTTVNTIGTTPNGITSNTAAIGGVTGNPSKTGAYQYGSPATGYFTQASQATAAAQNLINNQGNSGSSGNTNPVTSNTGTGTTGAAGTTGNNTSDSSGGILGLANNILSSGYTIPTTLQITPALVSQFLSYAHQVVDPQTQQALQSEIASVNNDLQNQQTQYNLSQGQDVQNFGSQLMSQDNAAGSNGVAFSGGRQLADNNLVNSTNRSLASLNANAVYNASNSLQQAAGQVGSANTGAFSLPTFATGTVGVGGSQLGSFNQGGNASLNYNPSLYTAGTIPSSGATNVANLQGNYLNQYGTLAGNNSNGSRSIGDLIGMMSGLPSGYSVPNNLT